MAQILCQKYQTQRRFSYYNPHESHFENFLKIIHHEMHKKIYQTLNLAIETNLEPKKHYLPVEPCMDVNQNVYVCFLDYRLCEDF